MPRFPAIYRAFASKKVFTADEAKAAFPSVKPSALYVQLSSLVKRGYLGKVKRGLYYTIPPDSEPADFSPAALLVASKLTEDSRLIYSGAILARGIYHNFPHVIRITGSKRVGETTWGEFTIKFHHVPAYELGFEEMPVSDVPVLVAREARIVVDGLYRPRFVGGFEEYLRVLDNIPSIEPEEVVDYVFAYDRQGLVQKAGLILEINRERWGVSERILMLLARKKTAYPIPLDPSSKARRLVSRWNIWVSGRFLERLEA